MNGRGGAAMRRLRYLCDRHPQGVFLTGLSVSACLAGLSLALILVPAGQWRALVGGKPEQEPTPPPPPSAEEIAQRKDWDCAVLFGADDPMCKARRRLEAEDLQAGAQWLTCLQLLSVDHPRCKAILDRSTAKHNAERKAGLR